MPHEDTENFNLDELDDEGDEGGETATPQVAPTPTIPKGGRRPRKTNNGAHAIGMGAPPKTAWKYQEAELLCLEVLEDLKMRGYAPHDYAFRVSKLPEKQHLFTFECTAIMDSVSPGDALIDLVTDYVHLRWTTSPQRYDITFVRKVGAEIYARGTLSLPSAGEIMAIRAAKMQMEPKLPGVGMPPPQMPQTHMPMQPPPAYTQPPYVTGVGAPPAGSPGEVEYLREQLRNRDAQNEAMRQEVLTAAREGRQPNIQPATPESRLDRLERMVGSLIDAVTAKPAATTTGVGAPQQVAQQTGDGVSTVKTMFDNFKQVKDMWRQGREIFAEEDDDEDEDEKKPETPVVAKPEKEENILPFDVSELPTSPKWSNGDPVRYARNRKTGDIDWMGAAISNPHVAEKAVDIVNRVGEAILGAAKRFAEQKTGGGGESPSQAALPTGVGGGNTNSNQGGGTPSI